MVRSLLSALLGLGRQRARVTPSAAPRFVPAVQSLEVREVPAVLAAFAPAEPVPAAPVADANTAAVARTANDTATVNLTIKLEDILVSNYSTHASTEGGADAGAASKVTFQDFSFTAKLSKASPML